MASRSVPPSDKTQITDEDYIFRPYITRDGRRVYRKDGKMFKIRRRY